MFKQLLVPLDRSPLAEQALGPAASIARASRAAIELILVHQPLRVLGVQGPATKETEQWHDDDRYLETIAAELRTGADVHVTTAVPRGDAVLHICGRARDIGADLIVMTSHGRTGLSRAWQGSVADGVVRESRVPVLMLRPARSNVRGRSRATRPLKRILVPVDGSALASEVLKSAADLALRDNARLVLLRVVRPVPMATTDINLTWAYAATVPDPAATRILEDQARQDLAEAARTLASRGITNVETHVVVDPLVASAINRFAKGDSVDLIALSTHGRGASRLIIGSVADKVIRGSDVPILIRRPPVNAAESFHASGGEGRLALRHSPESRVELEVAAARAAAATLREFG